MNTPSQTVLDLLELANYYPSPHNGQPMRLQQIDENNFDLFFDRQRGLQSTEISYIFSFVSIGVFTEHLRLSADALGHLVTITPELPSEAELHGEGSVLVGRCKAQWATHQTNPDLEAAIRQRQTSRTKYYAGVDSAVAGKVIESARSAGMKLVQLSKDQAHQAIWLNQRAVFDDMFDEPVRQELDHWLRYDQEQKLRQRDGLSYDCMELNGRLLKYIVHHPGFLRAPLLAGFIKQYYLKTMKDDSDVFYMMAPFVNGADAYAVGISVMAVWMELSQQNYYLHPFGTIMSNHQAHSDFIKLVSERDESRESNYLVFIFRAGKSQPPVRSARIAVNDHLMQE